MVNPLDKTNPELKIEEQSKKKEKMKRAQSNFMGRKVEIKEEPKSSKHQSLSAIKRAESLPPNKYEEKFAKARIKGKQEVEESFETQLGGKADLKKAQKYLETLNKALNKKSTLSRSHEPEIQDDLVLTKAKGIFKLFSKIEEEDQVAAFQEIIDEAGQIVSSDPQLSISLLINLSKLRNAEKIFQEEPALKEQALRIASQTLKGLPPDYWFATEKELAKTILNNVIKEVDPTLVLQQMRQHWSHLFSQITTEELKAHAKYSEKPEYAEKCPHLTQIAKDQTEMTRAILIRILMQPKLEDRVKVMDIYLNLAHKAFEQQDLMTAQAIINVFNQAPIVRLKKSVENLPKQSRENYDSLTSTFDKVKMDIRAVKDLIKENKLYPAIPILFPFLGQIGIKQNELERDRDHVEKLPNIQKKIEELEESKPTDNLNLKEQLQEWKMYLGIKESFNMKQTIELISKTIKDRVPQLKQSVTLKEEALAKAIDHVLAFTQQLKSDSSDHPKWINKTDLTWKIPDDKILLKKENFGREKFENDADRIETALVIKSKEIEPS